MKYIAFERKTCKKKFFKWPDMCKRLAIKTKTQSLTSIFLLFYAGLNYKLLYHRSSSGHHYSHGGQYPPRRDTLYDSTDHTASLISHLQVNIPSWSLIPIKKSITHGPRKDDIVKDGCSKLRWRCLIVRLIFTYVHLKVSNI